MAVDYSGHLRREAHVFDVPPLFFKVMKALRKSLTKDAYLSSDPAVFRGVAKLADKSLDGKDKAGDYLALFLSIGILIEDHDERRYYFDEVRAESLKEEASRRNQLSRSLGDPVKRLAALKLTVGNNKVSESEPKSEPKSTDGELAELYAADNEKLKLEIKRLEEKISELSEGGVTREDATELARLRTKNAELERKYRELEEAHDAVVADHAKPNAQITDLSMKLRLAEAGREDYKAEAARMQRRLNEANQRRDALSQELQTANSKDGVPKQKLEEAEARAKEAAAEHEACLRKHAESNRLRDDLLQELRTANAAKEQSLRSLQAQIEYLRSKLAQQEALSSASARETETLRVALAESALKTNELEAACQNVGKNLLNDLKLMTDRLARVIGNQPMPASEEDQADIFDSLRAEAEKRLAPLNKRYKAVEERFLDLSSRISEVEDSLHALTGADPDLIAAYIKKSDPRVPELLESRQSLIDESDRTRGELEPLGRATKMLRDFLAHLYIVEKGIPETEDLSAAAAQAVEMLNAKRILSPEELTQEHGLPYDIIRLITLYEIVKPEDRRSRYSVQRVISIALESGIVEEKESQPLLAACNGLKNEEKATFDRLLSTQTLPRNGLTTCIRTLEPLPWRVSEIFDTEVVKDFYEAFQENIEQQSPSH